MHTLRTTAVVIGLAAISVTGAATAQKQETKTTTETKTEVKQGKDITVTGCLERRSSGEYTLTGVRQTRGGGPTEYLLVGRDDLDKHLNQRVEIHGKAVTNDRGNVTIETKTKVETDHAPDRETKTTTEGTTGQFDVPVLGVNSVKTRSSSCR